MSSSQPQELANPGQFHSEIGTLGELASFKIWVDNSKENFCFFFVVRKRGGSLKRESDWIGKSCANNFFPEGDLTRMFVYETNILEDEGEFSFDTKTIYSTRCSLRSIKPSVALSEKYIIGRTIFVRLRKKDNTPVASAPSCLQQFSFESFFTRKNSTSQQMTLWLRLGLDSSVSTPFKSLPHSGTQNASQGTSLAITSYQDGLG